MFGLPQLWSWRLADFARDRKGHHAVHAGGRGQLESVAFQVQKRFLHQLEEKSACDFEALFQRKHAFASCEIVVDERFDFCQKKAPRRRQTKSKTKI